MNSSNETELHDLIAQVDKAKMDAYLFVSIKLNTDEARWKIGGKNVILFRGTRRAINPAQVKATIIPKFEQNIKMQTNKKSV